MKFPMLRRAAIFVAAALPWAASLAAQDSGRVPNLQVVNEHILRGGQPNDDGFKSLAQRGVKTVIDLRWVDEHSIPHEKQIVEANGMRFVSVPMKGFSAPKEEQVLKALSVLEDGDSWPVFVHCRRGSDRTGTILACYRISHDHWDNQKAISEAKAYGMSVFEKAMRGFIERFKPVYPLAGVP
jgi:tyrosine-protein phosphatase SIW14